MLLLLGFAQLSAQSTTWFFGEGLGIDFFSSPPAVIDGPLATEEGSAIITDPQGEVIFSTDGRRVYDNKGIKISAALKGNFSSTHSALIIPHPANPCNRFFVFTVGSADSSSFQDGLHVYEVRRFRGEIIIEKSRKLLNSVTEKLAARPHPQGGYWLVAHDYDPNPEPTQGNGRKFYAFNIQSNSSINNLNPIVSRAGSWHGGISYFSGNFWNSVGQMKFSPQGEMMAVAIYESRKIDLLSFDQLSGRFSDILSLDQFSQTYPGMTIYGVEFSPNGRQLYVSPGFTKQETYARLLGFPIASMNPRAVWEGRRVIDSAMATNNRKYPYGGLQRGPDDKIYIARRDENYISSLDRPDNRFTPGFTKEAMNFPRPMRLSLPTTTNTSNCIEGSGFCESLSLDLNQDQVVCEGDSLLIGFKHYKGWQYRWSSGQDSSQIYGFPGKNYYLEVTDSMGCERGDSIRLRYPRKLSEIPLPSQSEFCKTQTPELRVDEPGIETVWNDEIEENNYRVTESGAVKLSLSNGCDTVTHFIKTKLKDCECELFVADAFTPDGDGTNDHFLIPANCDLEYFDLKIFDRWGSLVFTSKTPANSWNGKIPGQGKADQGVYVFKLTYKARYDEEKYRQGHLTLIR